MIIEIHDIPNNQILKSLDIHIDFDEDKVTSSWKAENKINKSVDINDKKDYNTAKVVIDDITDEQISTTEIPKEMTDASF